MSYLLFMDESGHDHKASPFEVRGGLCVHAADVWPLTQKIKGLEFFAFGDHLHNYKSPDKNTAPELKGQKLLKTKRFTLANQQERFDHEPRQELSRKLLGKGVRKEGPTRNELTAFAQAGIFFVDELLRILNEYEVRVFASRIPKGTDIPTEGKAGLIRKDQFFLFERYHRFLKGNKETGLLILDQSDKDLDRRYVRSLERLFTGHERARSFTSTIVPSPIFVDSEMSYLVQAADIVLYILNWGFRKSTKEAAPQRGELEHLDSGRIRRMVDKRQVTENGKRFYCYSVFDVDDPWSKRADTKKEGNAFEVVFRAPRGRASN